MATATATRSEKKSRNSKPRARTLKNMIGGKFVSPDSGKRENVINPATGETIAKSPLSGKREVDAAVKAARQAFDGWANTTPGERSIALLRIADGIEDRAEEIADLESADAGKPRSAFLEDEIPFMVDNLRYFAGAARNMEGRPAGEYLEGYTSMIRREAIGVVGQITPWNYPLMMAVWKIGPALASGNTVVLKPAEATPITTLKLAELAAEVLPKGVLNIVYGHGKEAGAPLVQHPDVAMVSLTGSVSTGKWIAQAAADTLKRVHLELGGKAPVLVFDDADIEAAIEGVKIAGYFNAGQDCTAASRGIAGPKVYDEFVSGLSAAGKSIKWGDP